jgi:hypothetical protein
MSDYEKNLSEADDKAAKAAENYCDFVFQLKIFEALCKDFLAALKMKEREANAKTSDAELEMRARASMEWVAFRDEQMNVLKDAGRRQIKYENAIRRFEAARSRLSTHRAEITRFSGDA